MTMTDPIADMLTRLRNANTAMHDDVRMPSSKQKEALAALLQSEGYIGPFTVTDNPDGPDKILSIKLKYSPERERVIEEASKLMVAYVPYKLSCHRIATDLMQPWVIGFRRNPFVREFYKYLDVDPAVRAREAK